MKKKLVKEILTPRVDKPYKPEPHPQQARIDAMRYIPSLVTFDPRLTPTGK